LLVVKDVFWYVFPELDRVIQNIATALDESGIFFLFQSFPQLSKQFIGREVIPSPEALIAHLSPFFHLLHSCSLQRHTQTEEGPMYICILQKKVHSCPTLTSS
jgi:hypothetical protein